MFLSNLNLHTNLYNTNLSRTLPLTQFPDLPRNSNRNYNSPTHHSKHSKRLWRQQLDPYNHDD